MKEIFSIPIAYESDCINKDQYDAEHSVLVSEWINNKLKKIHESWNDSAVTSSNKTSIDLVAKSITQILSHKVFNFQSKNKIKEILCSVEQNIVKQLKEENPLKFFLLYNGGYRASPFEDDSSLIFEPDQTEMMLLYQVSLLYNKIGTIYNKGIEFTIVINNGVAKWVNDISITDTEAYANKLREMIKFFRAENSIKVLVQSELNNFDSNLSFDLTDEKKTLSEEDYRMVERFLGRSCSRKEAEHRATLYKLAESKWAEHLSPIAKQQNVLMMRQVPHPDMLSFRPFPGGATRIQNGTFGFLYQNNALRPKLITSYTLMGKDVKFKAYNLPLKIDTIG